MESGIFALYHFCNTNLFEVVDQGYILFVRYTAVFSFIGRIELALNIIVINICLWLSSSNIKFELTQLSSGSKIIDLFGLAHL